MKFYSRTEQVKTVQSHGNDVIVNSQVISKEATSSLLSCLNVPVTFFHSASEELKDDILQEKFQNTDTPLYLVISDNDPVGVTPHWKYVGNYSDRLNTHLRDESSYSQDDLSFLTYTHGIQITCMGKWHQQILIKPVPYGAGKIPVYVRWKHLENNAALSKQLLTLSDSPSSALDFDSLIRGLAAVFRGLNAQLESAKLLSLPFLSLMQTRWYHKLSASTADAVSLAMLEYNDRTSRDDTHHYSVAYQACVASTAATPVNLTPSQRVTLEVMCYDLLTQPSLEA
jgi:hypothetical protein